MPVSSYATPATIDAPPTHPQGTGEAKREPAHEHEVNRHAPRDREIDGHDPPQPGRRVKNVAVHRGDVRQAAEQEGIPLWNRSGCRERVGAEQAKRVAGDEHVGARAPEHDLSGEQWPEQRQRGRDADRGREEIRGARFERARGVGCGRHAGVSVAVPVHGKGARESAPRHRRCLPPIRAYAASAIPLAFSPSVRAFPAAFARYIAASARAVHVATSSPGWISA